MESKLRAIFLDQVEAALSLEPCDESLFKLFTIISPTMKRSSLETDHEKHFKKLRAGIHPDKHRNCEKANRLFQSLTDFYEKSLDSVSGPVRKKMKTSKYPLNFSCSDKWTYIELKSPCYKKSIPKEPSIGVLVAYQCINARGSIAHGKKNQLTYYCKDEKNDKRSANQVFVAYGGYKFLSTPDEIKEELMTRGPVVSSSFQLSKSFLRTVEDRQKYFDGNLKNKTHEVLITGWKHTATGEVWQIHPLVKKGKYVEEKCFNIAFGQYGIDSLCVAPLNTFENESWEDGPYFKFHNILERDEWYSCSNMSFLIFTQHLEELSEAVGGDLIIGASSKKTFTLQDSRKKAHSRSCILKNVKHEKNKLNCWSISVEFV